MNRKIKDSSHEKPKTIAVTGSALISEEAWATIAKNLRLSPKETKITRGILDDQSVPAIAKRLRNSVHTVNTHLRRIYQKLDIASRIALVVRIFAEYLATGAQGFAAEA